MVATDKDVGAVIISSNGTIVESAFYVGTSFTFPGEDENPSVAYNAEEDIYVVVYQRAYFGRTDVVMQV